MGTNALSVKFRWRTFWWTISKRVQVLLVLLVVASVAAATGTFLGTLSRTQVVTGATLALDLNCDGSGADAFPSVLPGEAFDFCLRVNNPSDTFATVHVHLDVSNCGGATAVISDTPGFLDVNSGGNACVAQRNGVAKGIGGSSFALWRFRVVYSAAGSFDWVFEAAQGLPP